MAEHSVRKEVAVLAWAGAAFASILLFLSLRGAGMGPAGMMAFRSPLWLAALLLGFVVGWAWLLSTTGTGHGREP